MVFSCSFRNGFKIRNYPSVCSCIRFAFCIFNSWHSDLAFTWDCDLSNWFFFFHCWSVCSWWWQKQKSEWVSNIWASATLPVGVGTGGQHVSVGVGAPRERVQGRGALTSPALRVIAHFHLIYIYIFMCVKGRNTIICKWIKGPYWISQTLKLITMVNDFC